MKQSRRKWNEVINQVQHANLQEKRHEKEWIQSINTNYLKQMEQEVQKRRLYKSRNSQQQQKERSYVEYLARDQSGRRRLQKIQKTRKQRQYQSDNLQILDSIRSMKHQQKSYPENPFVRLVEQSQKRKQQFRQQLRNQNKINQWQQIIKGEKKRKVQQENKEFMNNYSDTLELHQKQREDSRNNFKRRYLRLNKIQEGFIQAENTQKNHIDVEQAYSLFLKEQIRQKQLQKQSKQILDDKEEEINQRVYQPDSSPAFLGRNRIPYDRRKQLQLLEKSVKRSYRPQIKTQGNQTQKKSLFPIRILSTQNTKSNTDHTSRKNPENFSQKNRIKTQNNPQIKQMITEKLYFDSPVKSPSSYLRLSEPKNQRQYMRFDIIQGKNRKIIF